MALSAVIVKAYPLITAPLFLYFFTKDEFGALDFAYYVMSLSCILLTLGVHNGYARYALDLSIESNLSVKKYSYLLVSTFLVIVFALSITLIISIFDLRVKDWLPMNLQTHQHIFALYIVSGALAYSALTAERFSLNATMLIAITLLIYILPLFTLVILFIITEKIELHIVLLYQSIFNSFAFILSFLRSICKADIERIFSSCKRYIIYSFPLIFALVGEALINLVGRLFLTQLYPQGLGDFAIAGRIASVALIMNFFIAFMFHPFYYRDHNNKEFKEFWKALYSFFVTFYCFAISISPLLMTLIWEYLNKPLEKTTIYSVALFLSANLLAGLQIFHLGMHVREKTFLVALIYLITAPITVALNFILITKYFVLGASLALVATMTLISIPYIYFSNVDSKQQLTTNIYAKICLALTIVFFSLISIGYEQQDLTLLLPITLIATGLLIATMRNATIQYYEYHSKAQI